MDKEEKTITESTIASEILALAHKSGEDPVAYWNDWIAWLCKAFDIQEIIMAGGYAERFAELREESQYRFDLLRKLLIFFDRRNRIAPGFDAFGTIYESTFQSKSKASGTGQFFTPQSLCSLMAGIINGQGKQEPTEKVIRVSDPAVGSGRTLLGHWSVADRYSRLYYEGMDIDITSVRMCALNMMLNGMVGTVIHGNALSMEFRGGYIVNACKVPIVNYASGLEWFDDERKFEAHKARLLELMKSLDVVEYRPRSEAVETAKEATNEEADAVEAPVETEPPESVGVAGAMEQATLDI